MRIFTLLPAIIVFFLAFPVIVRCQITQNWARSFTASNGYNPHITTDGSGNIYVAGSTASTAYTLIKYNSAGPESFPGKYDDLVYAGQ
jgi:Beta-propeller repeat